MPSKEVRVGNRFFLTQNNPTDEQINLMKNAIASNPQIVYFCAGPIEMGDKKQTPHFHAYVEFKNWKSWSALDKFFNFHFDDSQLAKGCAFCGRTYALKTGQQPIAEIGTIPEKCNCGDKSKHDVWGKIKEMIEAGLSDLEIANTYPAQAMKNQSALAKYRLMWDRQNADWRDVNVHYIHGKTGVGKSRGIYAKHGYNNVFAVTNYHSGAFDSYDGQDVIVFEEFRSSFKCGMMLTYLDGHPCELPARYADKFAKFTQVYIVSNWKLEEQYEGTQENNPETWNAFLRRINLVTEVTEENPLQI